MLARAQPVFAAVRDVFEALLDSFVGMVQPLCGHWMPTRRLVFLLDGAGALLIRRISGEIVEDLGPLATLSETGRTDLLAASWSTVELHLPPEAVLRRSLKLPVTAR